VEPTQRRAGVEFEYFPGLVDAVHDGKLPPLRAGETRCK
jgi:hypothetical protein